jgi:hypothetical protein
VSVMDDNVIDLSSEKQKRLIKAGLAQKVHSRIDLLFHTPDRVAWADVIIDGHRETFAIESEEMQHFFRRTVWEMAKEAFGEGVSINDSLLHTNIEELKARALYEGPRHSVFLRVAEQDNAFYVDLCDRDWRAIRIGRFGWEVVGCPPVRFRRERGMLPLPVPQKGGSIAELRPFLNVRGQDFVLVVAWMLAALRCRGPYPVLGLMGEQGTAKSTLSRMIRSLIDPDTVPLRSPPRSNDDLNVAAIYSHLLVFDNVSKLSPRRSDAFCMLATGGGSVERQFYTKTGQVRFSAIKPIVLNGIDNFIERPDLQDRSIILALEPIRERKTEKELLGAFENKRSRILGALLDLLAIGIRDLPETNLANPPRMAEFATWAVACGLDGFEAAYERNRLDAIYTILEAELVAVAVRGLMKGKPEWTGTATDFGASPPRVWLRSRQQPCRVS